MTIQWALDLGFVEENDTFIYTEWKCLIILDDVTGHVKRNCLSERQVHLILLVAETPVAPFFSCSASVFLLFPLLSLLPPSPFIPPSIVFFAVFR